MIYYLAYGSNLHPERLRRRVPSCKALGSIRLSHYQLAFHKIGSDASGKCDAFYTGDAQDYLIGVVYQMDPAEQSLLDVAEDLGNSYQLKYEQVELRGESLDLFFYVASPGFVDQSMTPFSWYKGLVVTGARYHGLPQDYLDWLQSVPELTDPEFQRDLFHREILDHPLPDLDNGLVELT